MNALKPDYPYLHISPVVSQALSDGAPVVALESAVISHGLPYPQNLQLALDLEEIIRAGGSTPATVGVLQGRVHVGLDTGQIEQLAQGDDLHKISIRDYAPAVSFKWSGGTTVAGTMLAAGWAGIRIFATGGIGGVHRSPQYDISADLPQLATTAIMVVCAGAKAILDLDATLEYLDTHSVPVVGYQTDDFPAFFARSSGLKVSCRVDTPEQAAELARNHWKLGLRSAVLLAAPPPETYALPQTEIEEVIRSAQREADEKRIRGPAVTPFLLERINQLTAGRSVAVNLELLRNNARIAARVSHFFILSKPGGFLRP
ncbi:MAG: pseudouridine-5-phosphate glycosidase [Anaerolineae bacterium UTCFX2]|jgi:pseudouridine-5'-phosphate glycosidase|nr:pseudouridine-5'-phosphate glycosidase [Anaerolineales bacterium]OQY90502.1 MAG: pseudouridine-5-phosphate glycosidase [Anaerolineae bacterium UTCFX2]